MSFDPNQLIDGFTITYAEVDKRGGDCWNRMPAVYIETIERGTRSPLNPAEYMKYGTEVPTTTPKLHDIEVGCENYQKLMRAGVALQACTSCPLYELPS